MMHSSMLNTAYQHKSLEPTCKHSGGEVMVICSHWIDLEPVFFFLTLTCEAIGPSAEVRLSCRRTMIPNTAANLNRTAETEKSQRVATVQSKLQASARFKSCGETSRAAQRQTSMKWVNVVKKNGLNPSTTLWEIYKVREKTILRVAAPKEIMFEVHFLPLSIFAPFFSFNFLLDNSPHVCVLELYKLQLTQPSWRVLMLALSVTGNDCRVSSESFPVSKLKRHF